MRELNKEQKELLLSAEVIHLTNLMVCQKKYLQKRGETQRDLLMSKYAIETELCETEEEKSAVGKKWIYAMNSLEKQLTEALNHIDTEYVQQLAQVYHQN